MITSISKPLCDISIPFSYEGEVKMLPFQLEDLSSVPELFKGVVEKMISYINPKKGTAYLTVDGRLVEKGNSHRRGGPHIDGNFIPEICNWGSGEGGGGNGWKVGEGGRTLNSEHHRQSYQNPNGGMLIVSTYPACKGWNGEFLGEAGIGGDCSHLLLNEGFLLEANKVYYGNSQFVHESLPVEETVHRNLIRITLPMDLEVQEL